jgi:hypothetical protein
MLSGNNDEWTKPIQPGILQLHLRKNDLRQLFPEYLALRQGFASELHRQEGGDMMTKMLESDAGLAWDLEPNFAVNGHRVSDVLSGC